MIQLKLIQLKRWFRRLFKREKFMVTVTGKQVNMVFRVPHRYDDIWDMLNDLDFDGILFARMRAHVDFKWKRTNCSRPVLEYEIVGETTDGFTLDKGMKIIDKPIFL